MIDFLRWLRPWRFLAWTLCIFLFDLLLRAPTMRGWSPVERRWYALSLLGSAVFWWAAFRLLGQLSSRGKSGLLGFVPLTFFFALLAWLPFGVYFHYGTFPTQDITVFLANAPGMVADVMPHVFSIRDGLLLICAIAAIAASSWDTRAPRRWELAPLVAMWSLTAAVFVASIPNSFPLTPLANSLCVASRLLRWHGSPPSFFTLARRFPPSLFPQPAVDDEPYDYLWIVGESMGARYLQAYGAAEESAPALDALLRDPGTVRLEHLNSSSTCTDVSIPSLMSGMEATRPLSQFLSSELPYDAMKGRGYGTFFVSSHKLSWAHLDQFLGDRYLDVMQGAETLHPKAPDNFGAPDTETYAAGFREMDRIDAAGGHFFGVLHVRTLHTPYQVDPALPSPTIDTSGTIPSARYSASLRYFDRMFGEFWGALQSRRYGHKTIVFFLADHGESFGQHGGYTHCARYYDEETRVPGFVYAPPEAWADAHLAPRLKELAENRALYTSNIDILPTFLDLAGVDLSAFAKQLDGQPLTRALPEHRRYLISNCADFRRCPIRGFAFYQDGLKYLYEANAARWHVYDEAADPGESRDVAALHTQEIAAAIPQLKGYPALAALLPAAPPGQALGRSRAALSASAMERAAAGSMH